MRIALISDIHGNLTALQAVLADIARSAIDQIIFLGDAITLGPQPKAVVDLLRSLDCPCIQGNHEGYVLNLAQFLQDDHAAWAKETIAWGVAQLLPADLDFLRSFRATVSLPLDSNQTARQLLCFHGSPHSVDDLILAGTPPAELDTLLAGQAATVMACGHTHVQMMRRHRQIVLVNAGSVGLPMAEMPFTGAPRFLPHAEYAIIDDQPERMAVELRQVRYDWALAKAAALTSGLPYADTWVQGWQQP